MRSLFLHCELTLHSLEHSRSIPDYRLHNKSFNICYLYIFEKCHNERQGTCTSDANNGKKNKQTTNKETAALCGTCIDVRPPISGVPVPKVKVCKMTLVCNYWDKMVTWAEARVNCINVKTQIDWTLGEGHHTLLFFSQIFGVYLPFHWISKGTFM